MRFESPAQQFCRYVSQDVELHGTDGAGRQRDDGHHGVGQPRRPAIPRRRHASTSTERAPTTSASATASTTAWARRWPGMEGRIALEEILKRFPEWEIDTDNARMASSSTLRGWDSLPAFIP